MTLEQFKEKVKNYEILLNSGRTIERDAFMQEKAHEIAMNVMYVMWETVYDGFRESHFNRHSHLPYDVDDAWSHSEIRRRLDNE